MAGLPFGNGSDGAYSSATIPTITSYSCSGTSNSSTLTLASSGLANGDVILIHQSRGTGVGQWEVNRVTTGGGTTSINLLQPLKYTYTDSGASQAQVMKILMYSSINITSGTWSPTDWGGNTNGIFPIACKGTGTFANTLELNGGTATSGGGLGSGATGGGFYGGDSANMGEGTEGASSAGSGSNNGSGGGARGADGGDAPGGGGGNGTAGSAGAGTGGNPEGGDASGVADLTNITFGGGGGGGYNDYGPDGMRGGGSGGGIIILFCKNIVTSSATIGASGGGGGAANTGTSGGGGGAGGSILVVCQMGTLGTSKLTCNAGSGASGGGTGGVGRIAVHHSGTVTGTTSPTFTDVTDGTLVENIGGYMM